MTWKSIKSWLRITKKIKKITLDTFLPSSATCYRRWITFNISTIYFSLFSYCEFLNAFYTQNIVPSLRTPRISISFVYIFFYIHCRLQSTGEISQRKKKKQSVFFQLEACVFLGRTVNFLNEKVNLELYFIVNIVRLG